MAVKIAFIGTLGSGKTTLVHRLGKREGVVTVPEAARIVYGQNPHLAPGSIEATKAIVALSEELERKAEEGGASLIVCDRSALDPVAYFRAFGHPDEEKEYYEVIKGRLSSYDYLFLLDPTDVSLVNDTIRRESDEVRMKIHEAFKELLKEKDIPYIFLSGTIEERLAQVDQYLSDKSSA